MPVPQALSVALCLLSSGVLAAEAPDVQALLNAAIAARQPVVRLPEGVVRVPGGLRIDGARGLTVDGTGTTLVFSDHTRTGIGIARCRGLTLRGFTVDYDPLPFTQGTVVSRSEDGSVFEFDVHAGYPDLAPEYRVNHVHIFEPREPRWKAAAADYYPRAVEAISPRRGRLVFRPGTPYLDRIEVGDRLVLNKRSASTVRMDDCDDVRVEGVTFLAGPGGAMICRYMDGDNRFTYDVRPGPPPPGATEPRLMSTNADAFNYAFARRGPTLEGCRFSFMGDDSVNLHGATWLVAAVVSRTELVLGWPYGAESLARCVAAGDEVRLLRTGTWAVSGRAPVASFAVEPEKDPALMERLNAFWPRNQAGRGTLFRLTLREPLAAQVGDCVDIPASNSPGYRIANCTFADHRARGVRTMASRGVIEQNRFVRLKQAAISLGPEYTFWREAGWVEDVTVRGNTIEDVGYDPGTWSPGSYTLGAISVFLRPEDAQVGQPAPPDNRRLVIEQNTVDGCGVAGIWVRAATDVTVRGNTLRRVMRCPAPDAGKLRGWQLRGPLDVDAEGAVVEGNAVEP